MNATGRLIIQKRKQNHHHHGEKEREHKQEQEQKQEPPPKDIRRKHQVCDLSCDLSLLNPVNEHPAEKGVENVQPSLSLYPHLAVSFGCLLCMRTWRQKLSSFSPSCLSRGHDIIWESLIPLSGFSPNPIRHK